MFWNIRNQDTNKEFLAEIIRENHIDTCMLVETHESKDLDI